MENTSTRTITINPANESISVCNAVSGIKITGLIVLRSICTVMYGISTAMRGAAIAFAILAAVAGVVGIGLAGFGILGVVFVVVISSCGGATGLCAIGGALGMGVKLFEYSRTNIDKYILSFNFPENAVQLDVPALTVEEMRKLTLSDPYSFGGLHHYTIDSGEGDKMKFTHKVHLAHEIVFIDILKDGKVIGHATSSPNGDYVYIKKEDFVDSDKFIAEGSWKHFTDADSLRNHLDK
jgi:hypothetical protein